MSAVVILPTTGSPVVKKAIESVLEQTYPTKCYIVCDGHENMDKTLNVVEDYTDNTLMRFCCIPDNVGANGYYGHRIYAAFSHLVNEDYVLFLDQDCWFDKDHVQTCVDIIKAEELDWSYSLRKIYDKDGNYICEDNCESLGKWQAWTSNGGKPIHHIDTNTYCVKKEVLVRVASIWYGGWGQDRVFFAALSRYFHNFDCTKKHTVNYRLAGNLGSVTKEFFERGNKVMLDSYNGYLPWQTNP